MAPGWVLSLVFYFSFGSAQAQSIYQNALLNRELLKLTVPGGSVPGLLPPEMCGILQKPSPPVLVQYQCQMTVPNPPKPAPGKKPNAEVVEIEAFVDNDNKFMGLVPDGANDLGMTNRLGASAKYKTANSRFSYGIDLASTLYTRAVDSRTVYPAMTNERNTRTYDADTGVLLSTQRELAEFAETPTSAYSRMSGEQKQMVSFVDETRIQANFKAGKELYIRGVLGFAQRERDPKKKSPGISVQDWWHGRMLRIYQYDYVSPGGEKAISIPMHDSYGYDAFEVKETFTDEYGNEIQVLNPDHVVSRVEEDLTRWRVERPEVKPEKTNAQVATRSAIAGVAAGVSQEIEFSGQCHMTWSSEVGFQLESEGRKVVGPNSRVFAGAQAKLDIGKYQKGGSQASVIVTQALAYFPSPIPGRTGLSGQTDIEISRNGRGGVSPYFVFQVPYGRQLYDEFNDVDTTMRMGIRILVKSK